MQHACSITPANILQTVLTISLVTLVSTSQCPLCSPDYPHGITILSPFGSDKKQVLNFCAQSAEELLKFVEDLKESIAEVSEMEQIRIECKRLSLYGSSLDKTMEDWSHIDWRLPNTEWKMMGICDIKKAKRTCK